MSSKLLSSDGIFMKVQKSRKENVTYFHFQNSPTNTNLMRIFQQEHKKATLASSTRSHIPPSENEHKLRMWHYFNPKKLHNHRPIFLYLFPHQT